MSQTPWFAASLWMALSSGPWTKTLKAGSPRWFWQPRYKIIYSRLLEIKVILWHVYNTFNFVSFLPVSWAHQLNSSQLTGNKWATIPTTCHCTVVWTRSKIALRSYLFFVSCGLALRTGFFKKLRSEANIDKSFKWPCVSWWAAPSRFCFSSEIHESGNFMKTLNFFCMFESSVRTRLEVWI